jgi:hypothetical protein
MSGRKKSKRLVDAERERDEACASLAKLDLEASRLSKALAVAGRKKSGRGGVRKGAGRPAGSGEFDGSLRLRVTADLIARIDAAADDAGMTRADWARRALEDAAGVAEILRRPTRP